MRILVTGATGFVGGRLVPLLEAAGHQVGLFVLAAESGGEGRSLYRGDLLEPSTLRRAMDEFEPEAIAHLGGFSEVAGSWQRLADCFAVNVLGTRHVLQTAPPGCRVVIASSADVYGCVSPEHLPITEDVPVHPESPYAMSKAACELLAHDAGAVVVRSFNLVGPGQSPRFALPSFAHQLAEIERGRRPPRLEVGNLGARRDFLHVDDGAAGYLTLLEHGVGGEVYNLASGESLAVGDALRRLIEISGLQVKVKVRADRFRPIDIPVLCGDAGRLRGLGWKAERTVHQALSELWTSARSAALP